MSLGIRPCHNDSSTHRYPEEQTVKKQNNNWVRHARAILNEYILNGDFEAICHFWRDFPDFPYNQKEVNVIFAVAKLEFDSYVILDIWDRLGRNPSALKPTALLCVARHLIVMDREDEALLCWKFFADRYEKQGCRYDKNFEEPEEAVEFFRLGLELAQAEDADMFRRCARLLDGFKASANIRDQIRYHVLIGLSGDFVEISRRHPDPREKECTAEVETYVNFIRSCENLSVSALDDAPFAALAFKIVADPFVGKLAFTRIYSGTLKSGTYVYNSSKGKRERIGKIMLIHAASRTEVSEAYAGDICAIVGLKETGTGDTLCTEGKQLLLESMDFPDPVIRVAIEPKTKAGQEKMTAALIKLAEEDPTFKTYTDQETGQTIIAGMGELHLEIIVDRLIREFRVECKVGNPQVAYREALTRTVKAEGRYVRQTGGHGQYGHCAVLSGCVSRRDRPVGCPGLCLLSIR